MRKHEFSITVHKAEDIIESLAGPSVEVEPRVLYCDTQGTCFFDEAPNPYVTAMVGILNARGEEGWILVQVVPRERDMICFWRRHRQPETTSDVE